MREVELKAYGKINLSLDVVGRRPDGYHSLDTVMQSVSLCDRIRLRRTGTPGIRLAVDRPGIPVGEKNIAYRAARLFFRWLSKKLAAEAEAGAKTGVEIGWETGARSNGEEAFKIGQTLHAFSGVEEETGEKTGIEISIEKRIPSGAGMGGGSADAAAVLAGLDLLFLGGSGGLLEELPPEERLDRSRVLRELGAQLGADVPFCMVGGSCRCRGIGEQLEVVARLPSCLLLLCKPPVSVRTPEAYQRLDRMLDLLETNGSAGAGAQSEERGGKTPILCAALARGALGLVAENLDNPFEKAMDLPEIRNIRGQMLAGGALNAQMPGSGSLVYGIFREEETAVSCGRALERMGDVHLAYPVNRGVQRI